MNYRALVALSVLALSISVVALVLPPKSYERPAGQPAPAAWEVKAWKDSHCDRCRKGITADPQDGLYIIGGQPYWLHKGCVAPVTRAARR